MIPLLSLLPLPLPLPVASNINIVKMKLIKLSVPSPNTTTIIIPHSHLYYSTPTPIPLRLRLRSVRCRAQLVDDAPFAIAIAASIFTSLLVTSDVDEDEDQDQDSSTALSTTDARFAVMTLISFIPYFNCLSWVFALMDTGKPRYGIYALVYLAPYLRTNLSLSPDDSWLPISSILLCILHIQLEASITAGDLPSFNFFSEIWKRLGFIDLRRPSRLSNTHKHQREHDAHTLGKHQSRDGITNLRVPRKRKPSQLSDDNNLDDGTKH